MANAWITFLTKYYQDRKKKQPGYSYSDAMKDAKIEYNKHKGTVSSSSSKSHKKGKKMRGGSGYGSEASLAHAASVNHSTGPLVGGEEMSPKGGDMSTGGDMSSKGEDMSENSQSGGKKSRRRKGTKGKGKKTKKCKSKRRKSRSSRK